MQRQGDATGPGPTSGPAGFKPRPAGNVPVEVLLATASAWLVRPPDFLGRTFMALVNRVESRLRSAVSMRR